VILFLKTDFFKNRPGDAGGAPGFFAMISEAGQRSPARRSLSGARVGEPA
jgi:hypothetical protein